MEVNNDRNLVCREITPYLSPSIGSLLRGAANDVVAQLEEIRLRCMQPLILRARNDEYTVERNGVLSKQVEKGYRVQREDIQRTMAAISDNSWYAFEEEIRKGFITIPGGHRVGLAGQVVCTGEQVKTIKDFSSLCFRVARQIKGCADVLMNTVYSGKQGHPASTLVISPPRCGKTTILRDIARQLSSGEGGRKAFSVVLVDERSELAGSFMGVPQLDVGPRTDVLDGCPKDTGMLMSVRALSPQVVITDEIGRPADVNAIQECVNAGVTVISSIHAGTMQELEKRPCIQEVLQRGLFEVGILLSRRKGPGTIEKIVRWD